MVTKPVRKKTTNAKEKSVIQEKDAAYTGVYVNRNNFDGLGVALITILMPDETCGMFMMPTSQHIIWMGHTKYRVIGNNLYFTVQDSKGDLRSDDEKYVTARIELGKRYVQDGNVHDYVTGDIKYWKKNTWKDIGETRELEGPKDFDTAHEIRKIMLACINKLGNELGW